MAGESQVQFLAMQHTSSDLEQITQALPTLGGRKSVLTDVNRAVVFTRGQRVESMVFFDQLPHVKTTTAFYARILTPIKNTSFPSIYKALVKLISKFPRCKMENTSLSHRDFVRCSNEEGLHKYLR